MKSARARTPRPARASRTRCSRAAEVAAVASAGGIVDGANELPFEDDVAESLAESLAPGNAALTRRGPSILPESVTTGARGSSSRVLFPNSSQALNPVLCIVTSLYSSVVVPGGSSTRPVQMFPSVHLSRNPSDGSHAPNTSASPTTPTCRPYGCLEAR